MNESDIPECCMILLGDEHLSTETICETIAYVQKYIAEHLAPVLPVPDVALSREIDVLRLQLSDTTRRLEVALKELRELKENLRSMLALHRM